MILAFPCSMRATRRSSNSALRPRQHGRKTNAMIPGGLPWLFPADTPAVGAGALRHWSREYFRRTRSGRSTNKGDVDHHCGLPGDLLEREPVFASRAAPLYFSGIFDVKFFLAKLIKSQRQIINLGSRCRRDATSWFNVNSMNAKGVLYRFDSRCSWSLALAALHAYSALYWPGLRMSAVRHYVKAIRLELTDQLKCRAR